MQTVGNWVTLATLFALAACGDSPSTPGTAPGGLSAGSGSTSSGQPSPGVGGNAGSGANAGTMAPASSGSGAIGGGNAGGPGSSAGVGTGSTSGTSATGSDAGAPPDAALSTPDGAAGTCDRACLLAEMSTYLDAMVAHDPSKIRTASTLKYTDNGAATQLGQGLWQTASSLVAGERLDFADPTVGQVASQLVVNENGTTPVLYMVRLKVVSNEITEIESMTVRQSGAANGFFQPQNLKPQPVFTQAVDPSTRMTRDQLTALMNVYLDYLDGMKTGAMVPFDTNCNRYENGVETATGVSSFDSQSWSFSVVRRILIVDEEAGIVWGMFPFMMSSTALVVGEAFKMIGGKIMMIQAIMAYMPATAWN